MRLALLTAAVFAATAVSAQAPMAAPGARDVSRITGGTYKADPAHTLITWTVDHMGFSSYSGIFGDATGTLQLDPKRPAAARIDMSIPVTKVTTANAGLTAHLTRPGKDGGKPDFFGTDMASARFVSTAIAVRGQTARVTGNLTLNGVTRPVVLDASFHGAGKAPPQMGGTETVGFHATGAIKRSEFGIGFGVPVVSDAVHLEIDAAFQK